MHVRAFKNEDAEQVKELILSILTKEYPFDRSAYSDSDLYDLKNTYGGKKDIFFVLEEGEKIIGTAGIKEDSQEVALLRRLFVDTSFRGKGYGNMLIDKALEFCKEKKFKRVVFSTTNRMVGAIELCKKKGFKKAEEADLQGFQIYKFIREF